jgi:hypothetical protein
MKSLNQAGKVQAGLSPKQTPPTGVSRPPRIPKATPSSAESVGSRGSRGSSTNVSVRLDTDDSGEGFEDEFDLNRIDYLYQTGYCLKQARINRVGSSYPTAAGISRQFGPNAKYFERFLRSLVGIVMMRYFVLTTSDHVSECVATMCAQLKVCTREFATQFINFKFGSKNADSFKKVLFDFWKDCIRTLLVTFVAEFKNPSFMIMGQVTGFPLLLAGYSNLQPNSGLAGYKDSALTFYTSLLTNCGLQHSDDGNFNLKPRTGNAAIRYCGLFTSFFKYLEASNIYIRDKLNDTQEDWIETIRSLDNSDPDHPICLIFASLNLINSRVMHANGGVFFPYNEITEAKVFMRYFSVNLHKFIIVFAILCTHTHLSLDQWDTFKDDVTTHSLFTLIDGNVLEDRDKGLLSGIGSNAQWKCIKVSTILPYYQYTRVNYLYPISYTVLS